MTEKKEETKKEVKKTQPKKTNKEVEKVSPKEEKKNVYKLKSSVKYLTVEGYQFIGEYLETDKEGRDLLVKYPQIEVLEGD